MHSFIESKTSFKDLSKQYAYASSKIFTSPQRNGRCIKKSTIFSLKYNESKYTFKSTMLFLSIKSAKVLISSVLKRTTLQAA